jgi:hypothetical protein
MLTPRETTIVGLLAAAVIVLTAAPVSAVLTAELHLSRSTLLDMRVAGFVLQLVCEEEREFPSSDEKWVELDTVKAFRSPPYADRIALRDAWGRPFLYWSDGKQFILLSRGPDRYMDVDYDELTSGRTDIEHDEIVDDILVSTHGSYYWPDEPGVKERRTMADLRSIGTAVESFSVDHDLFPGPTGELSDARVIEAQLEPIYIRTMPESDAWGRPLLYWSDTSFYYIVSTGADGLLDMEYPTRMPAELGLGATTEPEADIVFANGQFVQWPEGTQQ